MRNPESLLLKRLLVKMVADTYSARYDKVHLEDFFFFIKDNVLIFLLREVSRHQTKRHIIEELTILVLLRVEEYPKVIENIVEQIVNYNSALDRARQCVDKLVVFLNLV